MAARNPQELHRLFVQAFNDRDLDALEALYETEAKLALEDGTVVEGKPAIREVFKGFLALNATMSLETSYATQVGNIALLSGGWHLSGKSADGQPSDIEGATAEVARLQSDGTWRYLIDYPYGTKQLKS
jgi:ketosteroid isomerase-like protein